MKKDSLTKLRDFKNPDKLQHLPMQENRFLRFRGCNNTRDLGGYITTGGKTILPGRLIRSGTLGGMNTTACIALDNVYHVRQLVDLRTSGEISHHPLPSNLNIPVVHIPILKQAMRGITRDNEAMRQKIKAIVSTGMSEQEFMRSCYHEMISDPDSRNGYRQLFEVLLSQSEGATIFFCSHGRDRTGIATLLILSALGVPEKTICQDYLLTPDSILRKNRWIQVMEKLHLLSHETASFASAFIMPSFDRLDDVLTWIQNQYGSMETYLKYGIGLSDADLIQLRLMYLTE